MVVLLLYGFVYFAVLTTSSSAKQSNVIVQRGSLETVQNTPTEKVTFFVGTNPASKAAIELADKLSQKFTEEGIDWDVWVVDCSLPDNQKECTQAGFHDFPYLFLATMASGIEQYFGPVKLTSILREVRFRRLPEPAEGVVLKIRNEDELYAHLDSPASAGRAVLVKFFESWCEHCKNFKPIFAKAAAAYQGIVDFAEVECSKVEDDLCKNNNVKSFPSMILFTGEDKIAFNRPARDFLSIESFLREHAPNYKRPLSLSKTKFSLHRNPEPPSTSVSQGTPTKLPPRPPTQSPTDEKPLKQMSSSRANAMPLETKGVRDVEGPFTTSKNVTSSEFEKLEQRIAVLENSYAILREQFDMLVKEIKKQ